MKKTIVGLSKDDLLSLNPAEIKWVLAAEEVLYLFGSLDGFWSFKEGNPYHAKLKSGRCSNGFFFSDIVLRHDNLCQIMANQLAQRYIRSGLQKPGKVYGIPKGAKKLGDFVADALNVSRGTMVKNPDDTFTFMDLPETGESALFVEDFCTRATAFRLAENQFFEVAPMAEVIPFELNILNRGGLRSIETERTRYGISALVEHRIDDFEPGQATCKMCAAGSIPIPPKATEENWSLINNFKG